MMPPDSEASFLSLQGVLMKTFAFFIVIVFFALTLFSMETTRMDQDKLQEVHKFLSVDNFNKCWGLIDKTDRTEEETEQMIFLSISSLWHWQQRSDVTAENLSIAYWQLGRVYNLANRPLESLVYGEKCLKISLESHLAPFFIGYAYETITHSCLLMHEKEKALEYLDLAYGMLEKVEEKEDAVLLKVDLVRLEKLITEE